MVTNPQRERVSLTMFFTLDPEKEIEPVPELVDEERPRRYGKTEDYAAQLLDSSANSVIQ